MASKEQRKFKKRKDREQKNHKQVVVKREKIRAVASKERKEFQRERRVKKLQKEMEHFDQIMNQRDLFDADDKILSQLEKNIEILKALEIEHNKETERKINLNQQLEGEGCYTLEDKMEAARTLLNTEGNSVKRIKETADVSVVKANS